MISQTQHTAFLSFFDTPLLSLNPPPNQLRKLLKGGGGGGGGGG